MFRRVSDVIFKSLCPSCFITVVKLLWSVQQAVSVGIENMEWADKESGDEQPTIQAASTPAPPPKLPPPPRAAVNQQLLQPPPQTYGSRQRRNSASVPTGLDTMDSPTPSSSPALSMQVKCQLNSVQVMKPRVVSTSATFFNTEINTAICPHSAFTCIVCFAEHSIQHTSLIGLSL